jgi:hypothetical protein
MNNDGGMPLTELADIQDLRELARHYSVKVEKKQKRSHNLGKRHRTVYFAMGIGAVAAGVVAGVTGLAESNPLLTGIAGFGASALAAITPKLDAERLGRFHFARAAEYGAIARHFEILAIAPAEPTSSKIDDLSEGLARCESRALDDPLASQSPGQANA